MLRHVGLEVKNAPVARAAYGTKHHEMTAFVFVGYLTTFCHLVIEMTCMLI